MRIGLLGGTFDPIHWGHLIVAEEALDVLNLDRIIFIPARIPPHKIGQPISATEHRMNMVELAIQGNNKFEINDFEVNRTWPTYTIDTVKEFKQRYPKDDIFFIMGHDSFLEIETWFGYELLFELCRLIVVTRPGIPEIKWNHFGETVKKLNPNHVLEISNTLDRAPREFGIDWKVCLINIPGLNVSATQIRDRVSQGRTIRYQVSDAVREYIESNQLYGRINGVN